MTKTLDPLILDLVEWVAKSPRPYDEVMAAWRTSCPRLPVLEDAFDHGHLRRRWRDGKGAMVVVTPTGLRLLMEYGRLPAGDAEQDA
jgi:hypothetical protein